ncbi:uncharacterized protein TEOVI_000066000 [Trypanosoma equiperdum]|uniref:Anaphase-promoting complex subunit 4 WD40 domain-containing protein n=2 Tax=Trypanozoon TaxID=39700 RepID=Q584H5_TRYB2|nr:hypothetical protein, conserved [Trypanosoma brucei brucei TREU927]AAX79030.1 hypothetical protein, conserved [Trypanosoma brucei]AAZ10803.1 hypothetical protein, conserved [Trypanosoma brucei brucei TREU927]SCU69103.1 hypothetical protein, conserved [Trypanosoma equiperdum]
MESPTCGDAVGSVDAGRETSCPGSSSGVPYPLFHLIAGDTVILAMEHNNHSKLLALSTSRNEIFVTNTQSLPMEAVQMSDGEKERWDPAAATTLVDRLRHACTQLVWAPWQYGNRLACISRGKHIRIYRLSHNRWALDEAVPVQDCNAAAFSPYLTMACACAKGKVLIFAQSNSDGNSAWSCCSTYSLESESSSSFNQPIGRNRTTKGCTCVSWDESGSLLAVGDGAGSFRVMYVTGESRRVVGTAYGPRVTTDRAAVRHLSWAPGAGRSFLILAVVTLESVTLLFFKRPSGGAVATGGAHALVPDRLQLMTETSMEKQDVVGLIWNSNGTRFVTNHTAGTLGVWTIVVSFVRPVRRAVSDMGDRGMGLPHAGEPCEDQSPVLVAQMRQISVVHLFQNGGYWWRGGGS